MVVVQYTAEGFKYSKDQTRKDNGDPVITSLQVTHDVKVEVEIEMPDGHVNLEAYAPARAPDSVAERIQHDHTAEHIEVDTSTIETNMWATSDQWVRVARRWISERPDHDVTSALQVFRGWDCTDSGVLDTAIETVEADAEPAD